MRGPMDSFRALAAVVDTLVAAKNGLMTAADAADVLETIAANFLQLHQATYGTASVKPKHHWLLDLAAQIRRDGLVVDAFVIERQHLLVKGVAEHIDNTSEYESSLCSSVLTLQLQEGNDDAFFNGLIGQTSLLEGFAATRVASKLTYGCMLIRAGDFICRGDEAGVVAGCALEGTTLLLIVSLAVKVRDVTPSAVRLRRTEDIAIWMAADVRQCLAWRHYPDDTTVLLKC